MSQSQRTLGSNRMDGLAIQQVQKHGHLRASSVKERPKPSNRLRRSAMNPLTFPELQREPGPRWVVPLAWRRWKRGGFELAPAAVRVFSNPSS